MLTETNSTSPNSFLPLLHSAIFTVILEHTLSSTTEGEVDVVCRSKFHFVDLAGSERAKRTGAQGMQLKEVHGVWCMVCDV
ncbi:hypothetical protein EON63_21135 [archaeon]|nr:MAG: hypothetical protein EON63_21135 [archaeon]